MSHRQRELDELYVVGKSALFSNSECDICDEIFPRNYHECCLKKEYLRKSETYDAVRLPNEHSAWFLSDYHVGNIENETNHSLRSINALSQDLNAVRYGDCPKETDFDPPINVDYLAKKFFPVTLAVSQEMNESVPPPWTLTFSPPATGLPHSPSPWRAATPHNRSQLRQKWLSTEKHLNDNIMFMINNPKFRPDNEAAQLETPYQPELSRLRLERLRLEEEILMEVKRQEELERIRGPQPKWYELRDSRFHYEAKKNNDLLRSCNSWQDLFDYRSQLKTKSDEFNKRYHQTNKTYDPTNYVFVS